MEEKAFATLQQMCWALPTDISRTRTLICVGLCEKCSGKEGWFVLHSFLPYWKHYRLMSGTKVPHDRSQIWSVPPKKGSLANAPTGPIGPPRRPSMQRIPIRSKSVPTLRPARKDSKRKSIAHTPYDPSEIGEKKPDWRHFASTHELRERQGSVAVAFTVVDDGHPPGYVRPIQEAGRKQSFSSAPPPPRKSVRIDSPLPRKSIYRDNSHERKSVCRDINKP